MSTSVTLPKRMVAQRYFGGYYAAKLSAYLTLSSVWFICEPLPDDNYEFVVKSEDLRTIEQLAVVANQPEFITISSKLYVARQAVAAVWNK